MNTTLIPERPLLISPTLAATIGLEETVMLHVISELMQQYRTEHQRRRRWVELPSQRLREALPFWDNSQTNRVYRSLQEKGLLLTETLPGQEGVLRLAINQTDTEVGQTTQPPPQQPAAAQPRPESLFERRQGGHAGPIPSNWSPDETLFEQCQQQHGIPRDFIEQRVRTFVMYQRERGNSQYSWHNTFLKWILREWRQEQSYQGAKELSTDMGRDWQPSEDAMSILEHAGIPRHFIEDSVAEFVLYWRERGLVTSTWNTKFIAHVRRQWAKYNASVSHDTTPRVIPSDYQPSDACFEVLALANIDAEFARAQIPEFVLYWQERGEASASWDTRFLQHVKFKWANRGRDERSGSEEVENTLQRLTDRSWAD